MKCVKSSRPLRARKLGGIQWPSFTGNATLVGTSPSGAVTVYVDASLGSQALQNAQDLLNGADAIASANNAIFGITGGPVNVIVFALGGATDGTGGADHMGCDFTTGNNIEVDACYANSQRVLALFEAELSECCMNGNLCGYSTGEALSRWCAAVNPAGNVLSDFVTATDWAQAGYPNFVDNTDQSDQNAVSTGCGMVFLSWLMSQGKTLAQIAQAMVSLGDAGTLATLWQKLGMGSGSPWSAFMQAVHALPGGITSDDPFGALAGGGTGSGGNSGGGSSPPPPPPPPVPPGGIIAAVDAFFAKLEARFPRLAGVFAFVNKLIDQLLQSGKIPIPVGAGIPVQQVIDAALTALIAGAPTFWEKAILTAIKTFVDAWFASHPQPGSAMAALDQPIPANLQADLQALVNAHVQLAGDQASLATAQAALSGLQGTVTADQTAVTTAQTQFNTDLAAYLAG